MENLAADTANMLDKISGTRAAYAAVQKDANARLILRIEKAVRESRKLRVAAEQVNISLLLSFNHILLLYFCLLITISYTSISIPMLFSFNTNLLLLSR
jgi:hypothetical protein